MYVFTTTAFHISECVYLCHVVTRAASGISSSNNNEKGQRNESFNRHTIKFYLEVCSGLCDHMNVLVSSFVECYFVFFSVVAVVVVVVAIERNMIVEYTAYS